MPIYPSEYSRRSMLLTAREGDIDTTNYDEPAEASAS